LLVLNQLHVVKTKRSIKYAKKGGKQVIGIFKKSSLGISSRLAIDNEKAVIMDLALQQQAQKGFLNWYPRDFADGLKMTMLFTLFGAFVFLCTRFSTIVLIVKPLQ